MDYFATIYWYKWALDVLLCSQRVFKLSSSIRHIYQPRLTIDYDLYLKFLILGMNSKFPILERQPAINRILFIFTMLVKRKLMIQNTFRLHYWQIFLLSFVGESPQTIAGYFSTLRWYMCGQQWSRVESVKDVGDSCVVNNGVRVVGSASLWCRSLFGWGFMQF